jgi:hypothetical protein
MWWLIILIPIVCGAIMYYNVFAVGNPPPDGAWVRDDRDGSLKYKKF